MRKVDRLLEQAQSSRNQAAAYQQMMMVIRPELRGIDSAYDETIKEELVRLQALYDEFIEDADDRELTWSEGQSA